MWVPRAHIHFYAHRHIEQGNDGDCSEGSADPHGAQKAEDDQDNDKYRLTVAQDRQCGIAQSVHSACLIDDIGNIRLQSA